MRQIGEMAPIDRREFLRRTTLAGAGVTLAPLTAAAAEPPPAIRRTVKLGRTGLEISDIGFGSSRLSGDDALVRHALERGITYFDTAESYTGGSSEETLGRALAGARDRIVLVSKLDTEADESAASLMQRLEA